MRGYISDKGHFWSFGGANGHGGDHWDVWLGKGKGYVNVLPNGIVRGTSVHFLDWIRGVRS